MAKILSLNINTEKRGPKEPIHTCELLEELGMKDDIHAQGGIRQLSLLSNESVDKIRELGLKNIKFGAFGENITTEGIQLTELQVGTRLQIGTTRVEISKIGKECVQKCQIFHAVGTCVMPKEGIFARIIQGGIVKVDDEIKVLD